MPDEIAECRAMAFLGSARVVVGVCPVFGESYRSVTVDATKLWRHHTIILPSLLICMHVDPVDPVS
jgi:hypothetical protein